MTDPSPIVHIQLDGPGKNALGTPMFQWLIAQIDDAAGRPILLSGRNGAFSAGLDLKEVMSLDAPGMTRFLSLLEQACVRLHDHPAPVVAAVTGHAIAGGAVLAACCDHRVGEAGGKARIGLNEVALGLRFPPGVLRILIARLPAQTIGRLLLGAELHSPEDALKYGLLDDLAPDPIAAAEAHLRLLAQHPPAAYAATKAALRAGVTEPHPGEAATFLADVVPVWTSEELHARLRAALKR
jgi:enoyl-CoA hydratase